MTRQRVKSVIRKLKKIANLTNNMDRTIYEAENGDWYVKRAWFNPLRWIFGKYALFIPNTP